MTNPHPTSPQGAPVSPAASTNPPPAVPVADATLGPPGPPPSGERRRRVIGWRNSDILRATLLVTSVLIVLRLLWFARDLFLVAFLGVLFGLAVASGVDRLERFRIPRGVAAGVIVLGFFGLLYGLGAWMAPTLRTQAGELRRQLPEAIDRVESWINTRSGLLGVALGGSEVSDTAGAAAAQPGTPPVDTTRAQPSISQRVRQQLGGITRYLFPFLSSTVAVIGGMLLIIVLAIYIGADPDLYHRGLMHLFPHDARPRVGEVLSSMATVLRKWLVTQLIAMVVIGVVTTVVLLSLRVKAAFALGLLAGFFEFVPTIGPIMSAVPAVAMGFLDSPQKALWVVLAYVMIQQLENHILIPILMKEGVDLPPALTILAQALMALLFGFLGLMVAVPLVAAALVPIKILYVQAVVGDDVDILEREEDTG